MIVFILLMSLYAIDFKITKISVFQVKLYNNNVFIFNISHFWCPQLSCFGSKFDWGDSVWTNCVSVLPDVCSYCVSWIASGIFFFFSKWDVQWLLNQVTSVHQLYISNLSGLGHWRSYKQKGDYLSKFMFVRLRFNIT